MTHKGRVSPFGHSRINACSQLPGTFRRVPRPSSPLSAKASTKCPSRACSALISLTQEQNPLCNGSAVARNQRSGIRSHRCPISKTNPPHDDRHRDCRGTQTTQGSAKPPGRNPATRSGPDQRTGIGRQGSDTPRFQFPHSQPLAAERSCPAAYVKNPLHNVNQPNAGQQTPAPNNKTNKPRRTLIPVLWWAWEDLNFRPHAYQACALAN